MSTSQTNVYLQENSYLKKRWFLTRIGHLYPSRICFLQEHSFIYIRYLDDLNIYRKKGYMYANMFGDTHEITLYFYFPTCYFPLKSLPKMAGIILLYFKSINQVESLNVLTLLCSQIHLSHQEKDQQLTNRYFEDEIIWMISKYIWGWSYLIR